MQTKKKKAIDQHRKRVWLTILPDFSYDCEEPYNFPTFSREKDKAMEWNNGDYRISDDKTLLSVGRICRLLCQNYWATREFRGTIRLYLEHSLCYGVYCDGLQIGFARAVTDMATIYWIADVVIAPEHRGRGLGKQLVRCIVESDELRDLHGLLATDDAQSLYEQCGFIRDDDLIMLKRARIRNS
jgi:GNAT superfamily N-acetyltransferase